jgi:hypothetical protein
MSPIALPSQNAVVLHGPKDLRLEDRTLWPPHHNQAQVAVISTGLCGSDRQPSFLSLHPSLHLSRFSKQCTTTCKAGTVTLPSRHRWF